MSQANIDSVQSWLSLELELLGIDAVVYSRHILNLFTNSHFTTDLHLAKKEANIFARLPPGPTKNKPKQKYRKRSNSSPFFDEIVLKKEMAADCLQSASDNSIMENREKVEQLIDDLYVKLNSLNLLSDSSSNSNERRVGKPKEKRRESYHDAFPLLLDTPDNADAVDKSNYFDTVWNGQNVLKAQIQLNEDADRSKNSGKNKSANHKTNVNSKLKAEDGHQEQLKLKGKTKKINSQRKSCKRRLHPFELAKKSPGHNRHKIFQQRTRERVDFNKENTHQTKFHSDLPLQRKPLLHNKPKLEDKKPYQKRYANTVPNKSKNLFDNSGAMVTPGYYLSNIYNTVMTRSPHSAPQTISSIEKDISHLYSIGLPDLSDSIRASEDAPSSKWFRDPQSGCLEFEPAYKCRSSSDNSPSSVESWLWCPSPSLWEDTDDFCAVTQSRFETVYKPSVHSSPSDSHACQLWKDYEAIFSGVAQSSAADDVSKAKFGPDVGASKVSCNIENTVKEAEKSLDASELTRRLNELCRSDEGDFDFTGGFSASPTPVTTQSRKEIWLKNATSQNSRKHSVVLLQDCFDSAENDLSSNEARDVWNTFDEVFHRFADEVTGCSSFQQWFFDCDMSDELLYKMPQLFFPFPSSNWSVSELKGICTDDLEARVNEILGESCYVFDPYLDDDDNVFSSGIYSNLDRFSATLFIEADNERPTFAAQKHDSTNSNTSLLEECITENQAWKSSLRIGNMWQSISGIRQVDVLYSEKQAGSREAPKLRPSSYTHFRPIHESDLDSSEPSVGSTLPEHFLPDTGAVQSAEDVVDFLFSTPKKQQHTSCDGCSDCDMKIRGLEQDLDNLLCDGSPKTPPTYKKSLHPPRFRKAGQDKSMQTSFEEHIRRIENDLCGSFSARPPKANSR